MKSSFKVRRKKGGEEGSVMKAEDIEGYRGKEDIDAILSFIEAEVTTQSLHVYCERMQDICILYMQDICKIYVYCERMQDELQQGSR